MTIVTRRQFLGSSLLGAAGLAIGGPAVIAEPMADMAVVKGEDPAAAARAALDALGGMKRFVKPGASVMVKPNMSWDRIPEQAATTNPAVVGAVVAMCREAGAARVVVLDNTLNDARRCYVRSGIAAAVEAAGGQAPFINPRRFAMVDTGGKALGKWEVYQDALDFDLLINVPVAKHHGSSKLSLGMKNLYGLISGARSRLHQNMDQGIADLALFFRPRLTIIDAYRILLRNGPSGGRASDTRLEKTIIASHDIVAADARASMLFGMQPADLGYVRIAAAGGLGTYDFARLAVREFSI